VRQSTAVELSGVLLINVNMALVLLFFGSSTMCVEERVYYWRQAGGPYLVGCSS